MEALKLWLSKPVRGWRKFVRALEVTTRATCEADVFMAAWEDDWARGTGHGHMESPDQGGDSLVDEPELQPDGAYMAVVAPDGEIGELPPDMPEGPLVVGAEARGRRAAAFRRYWVNRVLEQYPRVVGNWDDAALACTRVFLCKAMRAPRKYYVEEAVAGKGVKLRVKYKRGMTTSQIGYSVDWLVTAAHAGTPGMTTQRAVQANLRPNWLMQRFGLITGPTSR